MFSVELLINFRKNMFEKISFEKPGEHCHMTIM